MNTEELTNLPQGARTTAGRAWNAYVRMKAAQAEEVKARQDLMAMVIQLRGGYGLSLRRIAAVVGLSRDQVARYSAAYDEQNYPAGKRKRIKDMTPEELAQRGPAARPARHTAGRRSAPGSEPSVARTERIARAASGA